MAELDVTAARQSGEVRVAHRRAVDRSEAIREPDSAPQGSEVLEELLVEEITVDGMCGVY